MDKKYDTPLIILRLGIAFAFVYPAIAAFFDPFSWLGYFPTFVRDIFPADEMILLHLFGATEIAIALWILIGKRVIVPCTIASAYLIAIIAFNLSQLDVIFRDISILAMTIALPLLEKRRNARISTESELES
jgi:hypothetical protein